MERYHKQRLGGACHISPAFFFDCLTHVVDGLPWPAGTPAISLAALVLTALDFRVHASWRGALV
jgi:hypothetical protein